VGRQTFLSLRRADTTRKLASLTHYLKKELIAYVVCVCVAGLRGEVKFDRVVFGRF
jgi:hypothetical protein